MKINPATSLIDGITFHASPNCNPRPANTNIDLLVIHNISLPPNEFGGDYIDAFFTNQLDYSAHPYFKTLTELRVSAHLLIHRDGEIIQYVPFYKRAWHAGESVFAGRANCNDFSIGIELEGADDIAYTMPQYQRLAEVTKLLQQHYPQITQDRIVGHSDIAPGRKTDPGLAFDWKYFRSI
jgi:N-acetyl-anhydromuramoyl-L-alanine amidase